MKYRQVIPEILDSLPAADPRARRARNDLALINAIMGNYAWLASRVVALRGGEGHQWVEIGAGDGPLVTALAPEKQRGLHFTGLDFAPRPDHWPDEWDWREGDLFENFAESFDSASPVGLLANLFLHHFESPQLATLGSLINSRVNHILCVEPARYRLFRLLGYGLFPLVNAVTRHDLQVSIGAGFRRGELASALGLDASWQFRETVTLLGAYRFEAWKA